MPVLLPRMRGSESHSSVFIRAWKLIRTRRWSRFFITGARRKSLLRGDRVRHVGLRAREVTVAEARIVGFRAASSR